MKKLVVLIIILVLLVGGAVLCAVRWDAWFVNPQGEPYQGERIDYRFRTFTEAEQSLGVDSMTFVLFGDNHNSLTHDELLRIYSACAPLDFYAQLGDFVQRPQDGYWQALYHSLSGTGFDSLPIIACPGNHEYLKGVVKTLCAEWTTIFPNPKNGPERFMGQTYFVDFPLLRYVVIDTDALHLFSDYTMAAAWVRRVLGEREGVWKIVMMHHPVYSSGKGRSNPTIWAAFHRSFEGADLVFAGHDHCYMRKGDKPIYILTGAASNFKPAKKHLTADFVQKETRVYELLKINKEEIVLETRTIAADSLIERVRISAENELLAN